MKTIVKGIKLILLTFLVSIFLAWVISEMEQPEEELSWMPDRAVEQTY